MDEQEILRLIYATIITKLQKMADYNLNVVIAQGYQLDPPSRQNDGLILFHLQNIANRGWGFNEYNQLGANTHEIVQQFRIATIRFTILATGGTTDASLISSYCALILQSNDFIDELRLSNIASYKPSASEFNYFINQNEEYQATTSFNLDLSYLINIGYNATNVDNSVVVTRTI